MAGQNGPRLKLPGVMLHLEVPRELAMRLYAESRRSGISAVALARGHLLPWLEALPPAEFQANYDDGN